MRAAWWWIDRWRRSTAYADMTAEQQGVYRNLLDELWLRDGLLPLTEKALAQISGDYAAWTRVREVVLTRFEKTPDGYRHPTHDEVAAQSKSYRDAQADAGRSRAAKAKRDSHGRLQPAGPSGKSGRHQPDDQPEHQPPSPSPSPSPNADSDSVLADARTEGAFAPGLPGIDLKPPKGKREPNQNQIDGFVARGLWERCWLAQYGTKCTPLRGKNAAAIRNVYVRLGRDEARLHDACARFLANPPFKHRQNPDPIALHESLDAVIAGLTEPKDDPSHARRNGTRPHNDRRDDGTRPGEYPEPPVMPRIVRAGPS